MRANPPPTPDRRRRVSVSTALILGIVGISMFSVALALYLGFSAAFQNTQKLLHDSVAQVVSGYADNLEGRLKTVEQRIAAVADAVARGQIDPSDAQSWEASLRGLAAGQDQSGAIGLLGTDRVSRGFYTDDLTPFTFDMSEDVRVRETIGALRGPQPPTWMPPQWDPMFQQPIVAVWSPLFRDGTFLGAYFELVTVSAISRQLSEGVADTLGLTPFVLYNRDRVLAHPNLRDWNGASPRRGSMMMRAMFGDTSGLPRLDQVRDPALKALRDAKPAWMEGIGDGLKLGRAQVDRRPHFYATRDFSGFGDRSWMIGAHFSFDLISEVVLRLVNHAALGLGVLLISALAAWWLAKRAAQPVRALAHAAQTLREKGEAATPRLTGSWVAELDDAATAFNRMVDGLEERNRIRELFGKFVPPAVAGELLGRTDGRLAPRHTEATVLFVDLEGFTALTERIPPASLVETLNAYFAEVVTIIENRGGVITQFQGDAVLAVFNVPVALPAHAEAAVRCALDIQALVGVRSFNGHKLACRCGVATGEVLSGNVGAPDRLSYTVHGDAVNTAARLEQLNKTYGTRILVSGSTTACITTVAFRQIDQATVRGKEHQVALYTPSDSTTAPLPDPA